MMPKRTRMILALTIAGGMTVCTPAVADAGAKDKRPPNGKVCCVKRPPNG